MDRSWPPSVLLSEGRHGLCPLWRTYYMVARFQPLTAQRRREQSFISRMAGQLANIIVVRSSILWLRWKLISRKTAFRYPS